ncbi:hypothetical protein RIF29_35026 [Crotalaria pallida]|uniref:CCHC-type domain-containing protein n=1 Tax=Crotalaria pallida TaxID=3830 RepID=A0AAN9E9I1_CROPI
MVWFTVEEDYKHALFEGPWKVADHYLIVQRWRPFFMVGEHKVRRVAVWVRIPNHTMELCNQRFLWRVGSKIGTMLKIDQITSLHSRGKFARICVEIDLTKKLIPKISVLGMELNLEYEGLHLICFRCGKYGHKIENCIEEAIPSIMVSTHSLVTAMEANPSRMKKTTVSTELKTSNDDGQIEKSTSLNKEIEIIENPTRIAEIKEEEEQGKKEAKINHFGSWMMVKCAAKFKAKTITKDMGGREIWSMESFIKKKDDIMRGSCFDSLVVYEDMITNLENN